MAPPLTLTLLMSKCSSRATAMDWAAKASLASIRSMSSMVTPAFFMALREATTGPTPMILGSTPPWPQPISLAMGFRPYLATASPEASTMAAAPSLMPEALAAVTRWVPLSGASWQPVGSKVLTTTGLGDSGPTGNAPFSLAMLSAVTPALGYSSLAKGTIPS